MVHLKRLGLGMLLVAGLFLVAVLVSGSLFGLTLLGVLIFFGEEVDVPGMSLVNPVTWVFFGFLVSYVAGVACDRFEIGMPRVGEVEE